MLIFYDHPVTHLKVGWNIYLHPLRTPSTGLHFLGFYGLVALYPGKPSLGVLEFLFSNQPIFHQHGFPGVHPPAKIAQAQVISRRQALDVETEFITAPCTHQRSCGIDLLLPRIVERFTVLGSNLAKPIHTAHVMNTIHASSSGLQGLV
jgi:hypothetical protein